jgi:hypothetical protein
VEEEVEVFRQRQRRQQPEQQQQQPLENLPLVNNEPVMEDLTSSYVLQRQYY